MTSRMRHERERLASAGILVVAIVCALHGSGVAAGLTAPVDAAVPDGTLLAAVTPETAVVTDVGRAIAAPSSAVVPRPARPLIDRLDGRPIEVAAGKIQRFFYREDFRKGWFKRDATIDGYASVQWDRDRGALHIDGGPRERRRVTVRYHFVSPFSMKDPLTEVVGEIAGTLDDSIELALSYDGKTFNHPVRAWGAPDGNRFHLATEGNRCHRGGRFWVRIAADLGPQAHVALGSFYTMCRVKCDEGSPTARLEAEGDGHLVYRDTFDSTKIFNYARVDNPDALQWERGQIFLRGADKPVRVALCQKIAFRTPLRQVAVRVRNTARKDSVNEIGLSLDGVKVLTRKASAAPDATTELRLDDATTLADARQVYLHIVLATDGGPSAELSNVISGLEVEGICSTQ